MKSSVVAPFTLLVALAVGASVSTGCVAHTKEGRIATIVTGVAVAVASYAVAATVSKGDDTDGDGVDEFPDGALRCLLICPAAVVTGLAGLGLAAINLPPVAPMPTVETPPPPRLFTAPPEMADLSQPSMRPLPEIATDEITLRLAQQVRATVLDGQCAVAAETMAQIEERDPRYHAGLRDSMVLEGCR